MILFVHDFKDHFLWLLFRQGPRGAMLENFGRASTLQESLEHAAQACDPEPPIV